jgi:hypothetical protein
MQVDAWAEALRTGRALGNARPVALTAGRIALAECPALMVRAGLRLVCENHISFLSAAFPLCSRPFFELNGAKGEGWVFSHRCTAWPVVLVPVLVLVPVVKRCRTSMRRMQAARTPPRMLLRWAFS